MKQTVTNLTTNFAYDGSGSGELTQVTFPYGGHLRWSYTPFTFTGSRTYREIYYRYISQSAGAPETYHFMYRLPSDNTKTTHYLADWFDISGNGEKAWYFQFDSTQYGFGLVTTYIERQLPGSIDKLTNFYGWSSDGANNPYIFALTTTLDAPQTYAISKRTTQAVDAWGNATQMQIFDYGNLTTPVRTYTNTYVTDTNYTSRYIHNRLLTRTVTDGVKTVTLAQNHYDQTWYPCGFSGYPDVPSVREHDSTYGTAFLYRGNLTASFSPGNTTCNAFDITGNVTNTTVNGLTTSVTTNSNTNFSAPAVITTNTLATNLSWSTFLGLNSTTGPNGDAASLTYDLSARQQTSTSPFGAVTTYAYNDTASPPTRTATTNGHWTRTSMDGFGRTIKAEAGDATTTKSTVDTVYAPCGCSPLGKVTQVSQPYAPGATPVWTVYSYDGLGRTTNALTPDGASATSYLYQANTVTATDPLGHWKKFTMDTLGNLVKVEEPNPAGGANLATTYTYDVLGHLIQVSMPRGTSTQTRTFNYLDPSTSQPSVFLRSATNPENGTVSYTYNSDSTLATKTDAKGQVFTYTYDSYKRMTQVSVNGALLRTLSYDTPLDSSFSHYTFGRLTGVTYPNATIGQITEMYNYEIYGTVSGKRVQMNRTLTWANTFGTQFSVSPTLNLDAGFTHNEGGMTSISYPTTYTASYPNYSPLQPAAGPGYSYTYDTMHRLSGMTDQSTNSAVVSNVQYGPANELLTMNYFGVYETRGYNPRLQLTALGVGSYSGGADLENIQYRYSPSQNNGKITSQKDLNSGEEVTYQYDAINRLLSAATTAASDAVTTPWGTSFGYDGFGNLSAKTTTKGSAPGLSVGVDQATNRLLGQTYDANGNMSSNLSVQYDAENRMVVSPTGKQYGYDAQNKRLWQWDGSVDPDGNATNVI